MTLTNRALFIAMEGGEGAGKSTQTRLLAEALRRSTGRTVLAVQEPGTTTLGLHLRAYLKSSRPIEREAELLLFEASRAQLMADAIRPALERGVFIVSDRFAASSVAYQGYGRHIDPEKVKALNNFATGGLYPDLNVLLDLEPELGLERTRPPQMTMLPGDEPDIGRQDAADTRRFEEQPLGFHRRVRRGFLEQAREDPDHWLVVDAARDVETIHGEIWARVRGMLAPESVRRRKLFFPARKPTPQKGKSGMAPGLQD